MMKKIMMLVLVVTMMLVWSGCVTETTYPWEETLDLSLVERYEINIASSEQTISVESAEDIENLNDFLGNVVTIIHSDEACLCEYDIWVSIFLTDGRTLEFGVEEHYEDENSFVFSRNSLSVIYFEGRTYDEFSDFVKVLDN